ncbi:signal recognition particle-docking protein FtsY [Halovenus sp. WSH3]|uniref:Signal recognition particle receptor FtsY n=1 Tax=Halovenus carboxidivorans TaxID=2692199 RepID=A0A6B0T7T0_9EURY|nr:signal recognition particle-docking protein FtsY [Halovenus carboxidivorans]MXR51251.1 signal recognition particle-docking protein FtsY [Halovenus carboxidivorans]
MFDGLKDKLKGFTEDVEEDAEIEDEPEEDAETADTASAGDTDSEPERGESVERPDEQSPAESQENPSTEETAEEDADDAESEGGGLGLTGKAKAIATGKTIIEQEDLQPHLDELEVALLDSNVELEVAIEILNGIEENLTGQARGRLESTGSVVEDALRESLYDVISVGQFDFDQRVAEADKPFVMVFTGVNGVGKTTSIAKLSRYLEKQGYSTVLANGDTYRAGANEQLQEHADALDRKLITHEQGSDPAAVIYDAVEYAEANDVDVVLGDTAGRLHTSDDLMDQLEKIDRVIEPDMTVFVDEAVAGQDAVNRAEEFDKAATIDASILTKADADQDGGAAISVAHVTGKPILFLGTGQDYDDLERFEPERIVNELLGPE